MRSILVALAIAVLGAVPTIALHEVAPAAADTSFFPVDPDARPPQIRPRLSIGADLVVASETARPSSTAHFGGDLSVTAWSRRLGIAVEGGRQGLTRDAHASWLGAGGRLALFEGEHRCQRRAISLFRCDEHSPILAARLWLEAGIAREWWVLPDGSPPTSGKPDELAAARTRFSGAIGFDAGSTHVQGRMFFRVQRGASTSLVFGTGFALGR